jgi:hypothetical protein
MTRARIPFSVSWLAVAELLLVAVVVEVVTW